MTQALAYPDPHHDTFSNTLFGFWIYLMTDCILFTTLFATYAVLHTSTFGGATSHDLFSLPTAFIETCVLLASSFTCGLATLSAMKNRKKSMLIYLGLSFLLGLSFVILEIREFTEFVHAGHSWRASAFLSSFFTLVGTHGFHVSVGLLWLLILMLQFCFQGIKVSTFRRLACFSLFWHFLDVVWIFIFTFVYLMGVL